MSKRKSRMLDKRFQLRTAFSIIGITLITYLVIIAVAGIYAGRSSRDIRIKINSLKKVVKADDEIVKSIIKQTPGESKNIKLSAAAELSEDHDRHIASFRNHIDYLEGFVDSNFLMMSIVIGVVLIQAVAIYIFIIRITHRITGPIFVISSHIEELLEGKEPELRGLREGDEFQEFYEKFAELAEKINLPDKD